MAMTKAALPVVRRLPKYYRYVKELDHAGTKKVSSKQLAHLMGTTASQVRQDFNCFGGFGQQGVGYDVHALRQELERLLFHEERLDAVLIGVGALGRAIAKWIANEVQGYRLLAAFDADRALVGRTVCNTPILAVEDFAAFCRAHHPQVAVLCLPREPAGAMAATLIACGIQGVLNFSHCDLSVSCPDIIVENVHLGDSMMSLGYRVREREAATAQGPQAPQQPEEEPQGPQEPQQPEEGPQEGQP